MTLTREELGDEQYRKAEIDRSKFRSTPSLAKAYAANRGSSCREQITSAVEPNALGNRIEDIHFYRLQRDAMMFARMAFRGWRAYRFMVGE